MKENNVPAQIEETTPENLVVSEKSDFKGYSLEELRYQRALTMLRREFAKQKINTRLNHIKNTNAFTGTASGSKASGLVRAGTIASKVLTGLNYMDYIMIGFSAFGTVKKVVNFFRKKK